MEREPDRLCWDFVGSLTAVSVPSIQLRVSLAINIRWIDKWMNDGWMSG